MAKVIQVLLLVILGGLAAKLVLDLVEPLLPYAVGLGFLILIGGSWFHRNRRW